VDEAATGSDDAMQIASCSYEPAPKKLKASNSSTELPNDSCVMYVHVNNKVFKGSGDVMKKAKSAAAAAALLKLYNLRCTVEQGMNLVCELSARFH